MKKKNIWGIIIQTLITVLTAIGTSLGLGNYHSDFDYGSDRYRNLAGSHFVHVSN